MTRMPPAVILGADHETGLSIIRSLSKKNIEIISLSRNSYHYCCKSKYIKRNISIISNSNSETLNQLIDVSKQLHSKPALFIVSDNDVNFVSEYRDILNPYYSFTLPSKEVVNLLLDKGLFYEYCLREKIQVARNYKIDTNNEVDEIAELINYPCILKPHVKTHQWETESPYKVYKIESPNELRVIYENVRRWTTRIIIQEWVEGADSDIYFCLMYFGSNGPLKTYFTGRKIRQWPPEVGSSSFVVSVRNDIIRETSLKIFDKLFFHGLGSVEYKYNKKIDKYFLIEPTVGRINLQSYIATTCGVNFPYIAYCDASKISISSQSQNYYSNVAWMHEWHDFFSATYYRKKRMLTYRTWFIMLLTQKKKLALFSMDDPMPFFFSVLEVIKDAGVSLLIKLLRLFKIENRD